MLAKLSDQVGGTPIAFTPYCQNQKGVPEKFQKPAENSDTFFLPERSKRRFARGRRHTRREQSHQG